MAGLVESLFSKITNRLIQENELYLLFSAYDLHLENDTYLVLNNQCHNEEITVKIISWHCYLRNHFCFCISVALMHLWTLKPCVNFPFWENFFSASWYSTLQEFFLVSFSVFAIDRVASTAFTVVGWNSASLPVLSLNKWRAFAFGRLHYCFWVVQGCV